MKQRKRVIALACGRKTLLVGAGLLVLGGCLGPNPGFFIASSAASATIFNFVQRFWNAVLGA